jgi:hypothetical protein
MTQFKPYQHQFFPQRQSLCQVGALKIFEYLCLSLGEGQIRRLPASLLTLHSQNGFTLGM